MKPTPRAECGQEFNLLNRELVLTVTIGQTDFLDCITKKDFIVADGSHEKVGVCFCMKHPTIPITVTTAVYP